MKHPPQDEVLDFIRNSKPKRYEIPRRPPSPAEEVADIE